MWCYWLNQISELKICIYNVTSVDWSFCFAEFLLYPYEFLFRIWCSPAWHEISSYVNNILSFLIYNLDVWSYVVCFHHLSLTLTFPHCAVHFYTSYDCLIYITRTLVQGILYTASMSSVHPPLLMDIIHVHSHTMCFDLHDVK